MTKYFLVFIIMSTAVHADEDSQYAEIARLRQYPSGKDESDLKVQPVLNTAQSKKKKLTDTEPNEGF